MAVLPNQKTKYKTTREEVTVGFDFSNAPQVVDGETLANPTVAYVGAAVGAPTIGTPVILSADFYDSDGSFIPSGNGVKVRLTGGSAGTYSISCKVETQQGDKIEVLGRLIVSD